MNVPRTISDASFQAMVNFAAEPGNERALSNSQTNSLGEDMENSIVRALFKRLELPAVLERVKYGHYASNLAEIAFQVKERGMKELHGLMEHLKATHTEWPYANVSMAAFVETYWYLVISNHMKHGDYRRAWDDIRKAAKDNEPFRLNVAAAERHLQILIQKMEEEKVIQRKEMGGSHHFYQRTPLYGLTLILALYPRCTWLDSIIYAGPHPKFIDAGSYKFEYQETIIMRLAEHFAKERNVKRGKKAARPN